MKICVSAVAAFALTVSGLLASPITVTTSSGNSVRVSSARVENANGGSYVVGTVKVSFGHALVRGVHVHVAAYDVKGQLLGERTDAVNGSHLRTWKLNAQGRSSYVVFFPQILGDISKVTILAHQGHSHLNS